MNVDCSYLDLQYLSEAKTLLKVIEERMYHNWLPDLSESGAFR